MVAAQLKKSYRPSGDTNKVSYQGRNSREKLHPATFRQLLRNIIQNMDLWTFLP
jgi:hypothetical protein